MLPRADVRCEEMEEGMTSEGHGLSFKVDHGAGGLSMSILKF